MANSSVHFPEDVINRLDKSAKRMRLSRNRLIVDACVHYLNETEAKVGWPAGFFEPLPDAELKELQFAQNEMNEAINRSRTNRRRPPF